MKVLTYLLFFLIVICPASHASSFSEQENAFLMAKARKLGRSEPFSFSESPVVESSKYRFECKDPQCKTCDYTSGICSACNSGYYLSGRLCQSCSNIKISNGTCSDCSGSRCTQASCKEGYYNNQGSCESCSSVDVGEGICTKCNNSSTCQSMTCDKNSYNKDGKCLSCSSLFENCQKCDGTQCTLCKSDMLLKDGKCVSCPKNAICNGTDEITCKTSYGFYMTSKGEYTCRRCPSGCSSCIVRKNLILPAAFCTACESGWTYIKDESRCKPPKHTCHAGLIWESDKLANYYSTWIDGFLAWCRTGSNDIGCANCYGTYLLVSD